MHKLLLTLLIGVLMAIQSIEAATGPSLSASL